MIFKYLITFTSLFGFVCSASPDIRPENAVGLESRQIPPQTINNLPNGYCHPVPGQAWGAASYDVIQWQGIPYLYSQTSPCGAGPGPGNCVRVSCSFGSAIWLCNDNKFAISEPCYIIADMAQAIIDGCLAQDSIRDPITGGQLFAIDHFNVVVASDYC